MALKATKTEVWAVSIDDRAGGVADKLEPLASCGPLGASRPYQSGATWLYYSR